MAVTKSTSKSKQPLRSVPKGNLYITATFNNTLASVTDTAGNVIAWSSTGKVGFTGSRKSTPYAATKTIEDVLEKANAYGLHEIKIYIKGPGPGRDAALRVLRGTPYRITMIADVTPLAHNGTRPRKKKHNR
jgi:small subunit ribosomal protein S11